LGCPDKAGLHRRPQLVGDRVGLRTTWHHSHLRFYYLRRKFKNMPQDKWPQPVGVLLEPFGFVILGIVLLVIFMILSDSVYWVISDFFNPEFYALRHLPFSR
jgi:hypothetical protein